MEHIFSKNNDPGKSYIAFFDLDRTVISTNSGRILIKYAYKKGLIGIVDVIKGTYISLLYRFDLKDTVKLINSLVGWLKGVSVTSLNSLSVEIFENCLLLSIRPEVRQKIEFHKKDGGRVVLLSSAIMPVCKQVADHLEMDDIICSELETENGVYTGLPEGSLCFGKEKVSRLTDYCKKRNIRTEEAWYYGDSIDDLPVLSSVGNPVCVNPDKKLLAEAEKRGWNVLGCY
jgi:HAD superfamily hydrolase (TIGR01490 family)